MIPVSTAILQELPLSLASDTAMLQRVANLIEPVDDAGTQGSYAGWITRSAITECAARAEPTAFGSLLQFFQRGGSIRTLEALAARILPYRPEASNEPSLMEGLVEKLQPLSGWRRHRRAMLSASKDPLRFLKLKELQDRRLRLTAGEDSPTLENTQLAAYLGDDDIENLGKRIVAETAEWTDERLAPRRSKASKGLVVHQNMQIALENLDDDISRAAARRMQKEYSIYPCRNGEFEQRVRERRQLEGTRTFTAPETQNAVYFKKSAKAGAAIYVRAQLPKLEVLALAVHEDAHHERVKTRGYQGRPEEKFAFEYHGHGLEFLWRAYRGDVASLRKMTVENPLGFGLAFRDYYETRY